MKVATYIHGTERGEQQRLALLNRLTNDAFVAFLDVRPGQRVLEVGSGLGLLARDVVNAAADVALMGVEQSSDQIAAAVRDPRVRYVQGDAHWLAFESECFDLVYARYLLEHVADPERVLADMRRVTRPGGRVAVCENDISLLRFDPDCPTFDRVWAAFQQHQRNLGGDSHIGRRLYRLLRTAGFVEIELSLQTEAHWHGSPRFTDWVRNIIGNVESARRGLVDSGLCDACTLDVAIAELGALLENDRASAQFTWNRALAVR